MSQVISKKQVEHVAGLANLSLSQEEIEVYTRQLQEILRYVEQLDQVDASGVEPTYQTLDGATNVWREDEVRPSLTQGEALSGAKVTKDGYFVTESVWSRTGLAPAVRSPLPKLSASRRGVATAGFGRTNEFFQGKNSGPSEKDKYNAILTEIESIKDSPSSKLKENPFQTIGHKDLFLTKGIETTAGSRVLEGFMPQYSATVVEKLEKAGYRAKYKFNCDAWGHGSSGENSDFGATKNPWNTEYAPGGSSSGSAAAVAAEMVYFATGTDTGGSIRLPASFTNLVGLKPTYGAFSRWGVIAFSSSLDCPSLLARTVADVEKLFEIAVGQDEMDVTSRNSSVKRPGLAAARPGLIRVGIPEEFFGEGLDSSVKKVVNNAIEELSKAGLEIKRVSLPHLKYALAVYYLIATTETASNLGRYDGIRYGQDRSFFGAEAKRRIMLGTFASSAGYSAKFFEKAARVRTLIIRDFEKAFQEVDVLIGPVSPTPAFKLGEKTDDPLKMYLSDILTVPVNLAGLPGLALPCGFTKNNLPIGMQLIGPRWSENLLFNIGEVYQSLTKWHDQKPVHRHSRESGNLFK